MDVKLNEIGAIVLEKTQEIVLGEYKDYEFTIDKDGKITIGNKIEGEKPIGIAELLTKDEGIIEASIKIMARHKDGIEEIRPLNGAEFIEDKGEEGLIYKVVENKIYHFLIKAKNGRNAIVSIEVKNIMQIEDDIFTAIDKTKASSKKRIKVVGSENTEEYNLNIIQIIGNVELGEDLLVNGESKEIEGITKENNEYSVGSIDDVAVGTSYAKNTAVLKVDGNLSINENITLTAVKSTDGLGGPKGLIIYCTGKLTNNGTISMTARGAKSEGQNVYLWKNNNATYEYVPKDGADGGNRVTVTRTDYQYHESDFYWRHGSNGADGTRRQTGGGAAGGARTNTGKSTSGIGGMGNSYSGGSGGGSAASYKKTVSSAICDTIGSGARRCSGIVMFQMQLEESFQVIGGCGNPGGKGQSRIGMDPTYDGLNGTGGLLVIYTSDLENTNGSIVSNGVGSDVNWYNTGGSSGGGSINIFYRNNIANGRIETNGGKNASSRGGNGSISVGNISTGSYISTYKNY